LDKLSAAALEATLKHYLNREASSEVPVWQLIGLPSVEIGRRAEALVSRLVSLGIPARQKEGRSLVGGGSLPEESLPTVLVALKPNGRLEDFSHRLRLSDPPLITRIEEGQVLLDMRTVLSHQDGLLAPIIAAAWPNGAGPC
jgi:L-seryl-tRNA(Ser) seleniumtransferase